MKLLVSTAGCDQLKTFADRLSDSKARTYLRLFKQLLGNMNGDFAVVLHCKIMPYRMPYINMAVNPFYFSPDGANGSFAVVSHNTYYDIARGEGSVCIM